MATDLECLLARRATILEQLRTMDRGTPGGNPNLLTSKDHIDHQSYRKSLYEELRDINSQITVAEGPWEVKS